MVPRSGRGRAPHSRKEGSSGYYTEESLRYLGLDNGGSNHLGEGVISAFCRRDKIHHGGADIFLLESSVQQLRYLSLL